ncbi:unnamed protein product [Rotaria magnacalcarata]|uniref:Carbohydrate sulfotransferase n=1 Tax=Rotaria magnacalcarata TaxID=392030 RepID=A0A819N2W4_9BILA|nr:unnamed protein product [Rotaria magnacalcarata]
MNQRLLDELPIEILHILFSYFLAHEIFYSFLNINSYLDAAIVSYPSYQLNFQSISKYYFDLVCQHISPKRVIAITLSDDNDTCGQSEIFLSRFQIDQFVKLRSLTLLRIELKSLKSINLHLHKLDQLLSLTYDLTLNDSSFAIFQQGQRIKFSRGSTDLLSGMPLSHLHHLTIVQCSFKTFLIICNLARQLKTLDIELIGCPPNAVLQFEFVQLTRLILRNLSWHASMNDIESALLKLPRLRHLEISTSGLVDLADAYRWEMLSKNFVTLKFYFKIQLSSIEKTLASFRTPFWLIEKQWFVAYENMSFFTIPHFLQTHANEYFQLPKHSTCLNNAIAYEHITKSIFVDKIIKPDHRFANVHTLELRNKTANVDLTALSAVVDLHVVKTLVLPSSIEHKNIIFLLNNMPRLENLAINTSADQDFDDFFQETKHMRLENIHTLTICNQYVISNHYIASQLSHIFPRVKKLHVSVNRLDDMIILIDGFKHLSSASFMFKSLFDNDKQDLLQKINTTINGVYRFEGSCLHMWIENRMDISRKTHISNISWTQRLEKFWHYLDFMLSQESPLSRLFTIFLIAYLHNIATQIWIYLVPYIALNLFVCQTILGSSSFVYLSPIGSLFSKYFDRPSTYLFGYLFVYIIIIVGYIFSDEWKLMIADNKSFSSAFLCIGIVLFSYLIVHKLYQTSSTNVRSTHQSSDIAFTDKDHNTCVDDSKLSLRILSSVIFRSDTINYLGFVLRSHSLFYCSVPKVATRTFLTFVTYLHIRDDLIPLLTNKSTLSNWNSQRKANPFDFNNINQILSSPMKNDSQPSLLNSISILKSFLSLLVDFNKKNVTDFDVWSIYQRKSFPLIRPQTLANVSLIFSSNFTRVIFVRHPLERLASAYVDKIASLTNEPFLLYDSIRRAICRKYSSFYLTDAQRKFYRIHRRIPKKIEEPCHNVVPKFEHFIAYIMSNSMINDVHWYPYSKLCYTCLFKYNFIGKYETIEEDLGRLLTYLGLESKDWNNVNYFRTGKTREHYKSMYSSLNNQLLCTLKYVYRDDFKLFDYRLEDYLTDNITITCSPSHERQLRKIYKKLNLF